MECGILDIFKAACELNNNATIIVEVSIGVFLAAFLYRMQHKSSKKQREVWESQRRLIYLTIFEHYDELEYYLRGILSNPTSGSSFVEGYTHLNRHCKKLDEIIDTSREFIDVYDFKEIKKLTLTVDQLKGKNVRIELFLTKVHDYQYHLKENRLEVDHT